MTDKKISKESPLMVHLHLPETIRIIKDMPKNCPGKNCLGFEIASAEQALKLTVDLEAIAMDINDAVHEHFHSVSVPVTHRPINNHKCSCGWEGDHINVHLSDVRLSARIRT